MCEEQRGGPCGAPTGRAEAVSALVNLGGDTVVGSVHIFAADVGLGVGSDRTSGGRELEGSEVPPGSLLGPSVDSCTCRGRPRLDGSLAHFRNPETRAPGSTGGVDRALGGGG